ncbi:hypothetical protein [Sinorhizobium meliloti]
MNELHSAISEGAAMSKTEDKTTKHKDLPQINEERIKSLSTSYLDDKLSSAGNPKPSSGGNKDKDSA